MARDPKNSTRPATTTEVWYDANKKIRERCPDLIINTTTGGGPDMTMEERLRCVPARPEMASLNLTPDMSKFKIAARKPPLPFPREEMLYDECLPFIYKLVNQFAAEMKKHGIKPEMETYHTGGPWVMRDLTTFAMLLGGHIRVGLEDNVYCQRGQKATSNAQLDERAAQLANELGPGVATRAQARDMLGLSAVPSRY